MFGKIEIKEDLTIKSHTGHNVVLGRGEYCAFFFSVSVTNEELVAVFPERGFIIFYQKSLERLEGEGRLTIIRNN